MVVVFVLNCDCSYYYWLVWIVVERVAQFVDWWWLVPVFYLDVVV